MPLPDPEGFPRTRNEKARMGRLRIKLYATLGPGVKEREGEQ
jgi:hypothetical protein